MKFIDKLILLVVAWSILSACNRDQEPRLYTHSHMIEFGEMGGEEVVYIVSEDSGETVNYTWSDENFVHGFKLLQESRDLKRMSNGWLEVELDMSNRKRIRVIFRVQPNDAEKERRTRIHAFGFADDTVPQFLVIQKAHN